MTNIITIPHSDQAIKEFFLSVKDIYTYDVKHFINYLDSNHLPFSFEAFKSYALEMYNDSGVKTSTYNKRVLSIKRRNRANPCRAKLSNLRAESCK